LGKYDKDPFESETDTTCTINSPEVDDELPVAMGWHPAGHEAAAPQDEPDPPLPPQYELLPPLLPPYWATAVAARRDERTKALKDMTVCFVLVLGRVGLCYVVKSGNERPAQEKRTVAMRQAAEGMNRIRREGTQHGPKGGYKNDRMEEEKQFREEAATKGS
jgi:hypothetical protein